MLALSGAVSALTALSGGTLITAGTGIELAAVGLQALSGLMAHRYQQALYTQQAKLEKINAQRAAFAGQLNQQDADLEAILAFGEIESAQAASGLDLNSPSFRKRRQAERDRARLNALRIRQDATEAEVDALNRADLARTSAEAEGSAAIFSIFEGMALGSASLLGAATKVNELKARRLRGDASKVN